MTNRRKPARRYKDSGPVRFTVTQIFEIPRREIKKVFDYERKTLLSELEEDGEDQANPRYLAKIRKLTLKDFIVELDSNFADSVLMGEFDPADRDEMLDWIAGQFDSWTDQ